jgi:2',3'-cyclic-nucleotide 2'-phosphodiesterase (5'-nucleotidase family)
MASSTWEGLGSRAAQAAPGEFGSFQHVSGLKYTINTAVASSVVMDDKGMLQSIGDKRRVCNVQVLGEDGTYTPIDPNATYTLASHNYMIKQGGSGVDHFMDNKLIADEVMIDNQVLIGYIRDELSGVVGQEYADPYGQGRITIIDKEASPETSDAGMYLPMVVMVACLLSVTAIVKKKVL